MKQFDTTHKLFTPAQAETIAAALQSGDPDWTYTVVHDPKGTGYSFITITEEDGAIVGRV